MLVGECFTPFFDYEVQEGAALEMADLAGREWHCPSWLPACLAFSHSTPVEGEVGRHVSAGPSQPGLSTIDPRRVGGGKTGGRGEIAGQPCCFPHTMTGVGGAGSGGSGRVFLFSGKRSCRELLFFFRNRHQSI